MSNLSLSWGWRWLVVQTKRRLIRPMLRGQHPPEYTARGTGVGLFLSLTPTVGFQIPMVLGIWMLTKRWIHRWDFNPAVACAWTLISNVVTLPPLYYLFTVTGRMIMGRWEKLRGFETFSQRLEKTTETGQQGLDALWAQLVGLMETFGWPMLVGSLPWAIVGGGVGYWLTLRFLERHRSRMDNKRVQLAIGNLIAPSKPDPGLPTVPTSNANS
ncbi:MAG: DUF2062 domain-containing protein [Magnetococcales bacterium]|nr:DUF2062 domain-containing protein [Magnetococcales bacterium]